MKKVWTLNASYAMFFLSNQATLHGVFCCLSNKLLRGRNIMLKSISYAVGLLLISATSQVKADTAFDANAISFTAIPASDNFAIVDNSATIVKTQLANGFSVNYVYTLTSKVANQTIDTTWSADRLFSLPAVQTLAVTISGNVSATMPAGDSLELLVTGAVLPQNLDTIFSSGVLKGALNNKAIKWNETSKGMAFAANNANGYTLDVFSGPDWTPGAVGDVLTIDALYTVTVGPLPQAVPEASTWAMMLLGFAGLGYVGYRTSKSPVAIG
jgi:hypothetical protein